MQDVAELLRPYLRQLMRATRARAATVFLPPSMGAASRPQLLHIGESPAVPELADLDAAEAFTARFRDALETGSGARRRSASTACGVLQSSRHGGVLVPIPSLATLWQRVAADPGPSDPEMPARSCRADDNDASFGGSGWIGLRLDTPDAVSPALAAAGGDGSAPSALWEHLLDLSGTLASYFVGLYGIVADSVTGLPGRTALQATISGELDYARRSRRPFSLLLVNPRDFGAVNARFGCHTGDVVLREVVVRLLAAVRACDPVMRYGAAIFAVTLRRADREAAKVVGRNIRSRLSDSRFLDDSLPLAFSVGIATVEPDGESTDDPLDLIQRADLALAAAHEVPGGSVCVWSQALEHHRRKVDRLGGIFTGTINKDYRNMSLLWDALGAVAVNANPEELATRVVEKLSATLGAERVALFERTPADPCRLMAGLRRSEQADIPFLPLVPDDLTPGEKALLARASSDARALREEVDEPGSARIGGYPLLGHAVPLMVGEGVAGLLYLVGSQGDQGFDSSDLSFLSAFGAQVAVALDRARLAQQERQRREQEQRLLRAELHDLRNAVRQAKLLYQSPAMEKLLTTVRRIAATDTTVLITGESGTGKERLAHTLHELSNRRSKPFIIVDCGAIPPTLIESELFGHERGAFTGAEQRAVGRLAQADGGTVVLDEVGELPLEVQAKLLRFVQEKHVTPVGGTRPRGVDARIIAVTNRDLEREVSAGRFREDLYYRLNVVRLKVPPLRERREDVLFLARHFMEVFSLQYGKAIKFIAPEAEELMRVHSWPGNVRELQNRVLQAVILTGGETLEVNVLGIAQGDFDDAMPPVLPAEARLRIVPPFDSSDRGGLSPAHSKKAAVPPAALPAGSAASLPAATGRVWERLRETLGVEVESALREGGTPMPIGKWLWHEAALVSHELSGGVLARAAALLGVPESTFARRYRKAAADLVLTRRSATWPNARSALADLLRDPGGVPRECLTDRLDAVILEEVVARVSDDVQVSSQLLGITPPTFRRRIAAMPLAS